MVYKLWGRIFRPMNTLKIIYSITVLCCISLLIGCNSIEIVDDTPTLSQLEQIQTAGVLKVASRNGSTTFFEGRNGPTGFEYHLAKEFADELGVTLEITNNESLDSIFTGLETGDINIAAAGLTKTQTKTQTKKTGAIYSSAYLDITQQLIYHSRNKAPTSPKDLIGRSILVIANSAHTALLTELKQTYPELTWIEQEDAESTELLDKIESGEIEFTIINSNEYAVNRGLYPNTRIAFDIAEPQQLAWALSNNKDTLDDSLELAVNQFMNRISTDGTLVKLKDIFYGHANNVDQIGSKTFMRKIKQRLPKYVDEFKTAAELYNLDWQLLAAVAYQESHLNPLATSPTGVRGMMMLTQITAKEVGIKNRIDAKQSIHGGAKYLSKIMKRFSDIDEADRTWFTLAAYNVGFGHVRDARKITDLQGGNPNRWMEVKERLPLLQKKAYYKYTRYGYARGQEPVTYVQNIRHFYNLLTWSTILEQRHIASADIPTIKTVSYETTQNPTYLLSLL